MAKKPYITGFATLQHLQHLLYIVMQVLHSLLFSEKEKNKMYRKCNSRIRPYMNTEIVLLIEEVSLQLNTPRGEVIERILFDSDKFKAILDRFKDGEYEDIGLQFNEAFL